MYRVIHGHNVLTVGIMINITSCMFSRVTNNDGIIKVMYRVIHGHNVLTGIPKVICFKAVDRRFLLLLAGDIESNPGPEFDKGKCPCDEEIRTRTQFVICASCAQRWHASCAGLDDIIDKNLGKRKTNWKCFLCYSPPTSVKEKMEEEEKQKLEIDPVDPLKGIYKKIKEMDEKIDLINQNKGPSFSRIAAKAIDTNLNRIVNKINEERANNPEEEKNRQDRTVVVKHYGDKKTRTAGDIKKQINEEFPLTAIRKARTTPGGSIVIEFDDKETADRVEKSWKNSLFGGNRGLMRGNKPRNAGIIKHVNSDRTIEEMEEEIKNSYDCEVEFFKKKDRFTGTIKIKFNNGDEYQNALSNRIRIFEQIYIMEEFVFRPRIVMCQNCLKYGHPTRLCDSKTVCGHCKSQEHGTDDCEIDEQEYKCYHCDGKHPTFHRSCIVQQAKEEQIKSRFNNGW